MLLKGLYLEGEHKEVMKRLEIKVNFGYNQSLIYHD